VIENSFLKRMYQKSLKSWEKRFEKKAPAGQKIIAKKKVSNLRAIAL
jgi:hypothetical protein